MFDFGLANEEQKQAIQTVDGPVLIIAGPGTGKTFTLVKRISYLIVEKGVKPQEIMVVTFTEKAAKELLTRISDEFVRNDLNLNVNEMYIGTFHSVCLRILRENTEKAGDNSKSRMLDAFEQTYLVCMNIDNFNRLPGFTSHSPARQGVWKQSLDVCRYVNQMMEELVDIEAMKEDQDEDIRFLGKLVSRYQELLDRNGAMDFSSIQTNTYEMLSENPEVLEEVRERIKYIMVDEYQDTNYIQERLVFQIAGDRQNICVVGDDDQGMYRFRGATIRNILEFPEKFEDGSCRIIHLDKNYRSEPGIIDFYNSWMENVDGINLFNWDKYRYEKNIHAEKETKENGDTVFVCGGDDIEIEKHDVLYLIRKLQDNGNITDLNQVAFLFRSVKGNEAVELGHYLEENGISVYSPRSEMFFERTEVKQIFGCIMMCFRSYLKDLKQNVFRYPIPDKLREYYISCVKAANEVYKSCAGLNEYINRQAKDILDLKETADYGLLDIFYKILSFEPFNEWLGCSLQDNVMKTRPARNLSEISRLIARFRVLHDMHDLSPLNRSSMPEELFNIYVKYLYIDGIGEYEDESEYAPSGCVSFMTIHQSKGLEFPVVVVGSLGNVPKKNSDPLMMTAEFRFFHRRPFEPLENIKYFDFWRLYYTAFSRAQNLLVLATKKEDSKYFSESISKLPSVHEFEGQAVFDNVKKVNYKRMYSFTSHIAVYDGCPTQYKFYKEYGFVQNKMFHTSVGSLVHATLEDLNNCVIDGHVEMVSEQAIRNWFDLNYKSMQEQTGYYLTEDQRSNALDQVIRYFHHRKEELGKVWKAEEEINLVLPDYILQGVIDLVEGQGDTVEIVDYKTGPKPNIEGHPERVEHYRKQLEIYAYLIEKRYKKAVSRMHLYYTSVLEGNPIITFEWKRENIDHTVEEISDTVKNIEGKVFNDKARNNYACRFCDMKYVCGIEKA